MAKRKLGKVAKRKQYMGKMGILRWVFIPCALVIIATGLYSIWQVNNKNSTQTNIEYIRSFQTTSGALYDVQNKLGMHDPKKDIKWYKTKDEITIEFGRIILDWTPEEFFEQSNLDALGTIGFTTKIKKDADGNQVLHLYYKEEEVERWVR